MRDHGEKRLSTVLYIRERTGLEGFGLVQVIRPMMGTLIAGSLIRKRSRRHIGDHLASPTNDGPSAIGDGSAHGRIQAPFFENIEDNLLFPFSATISIRS